MKPLAPGFPAPDFTVDPESGRTLRALLRETGAPALIYFYPADFSPVCTAQACMVRNALEDAPPGLTTIGVSPQSAASHARFARALKLNQILVSDPGKTIARAYGCLGLLGVVRRISFLVSPEGLIAGRAAGSLSLRAHRELIERAARSVN